MQVTLTRTKYTPNVTLGTLAVPGIEQLLYTMEEAWLDNHPGKSCIPKGGYVCKPHGWEKHTVFKKKRVWEVTAVPNRMAILFHVGNGKDDTEGCILVGTSTSGENVWHSQTAIDLMRTAIGQKGFDLTVQDAMLIA